MIRFREIILLCLSLIYIPCSAQSSQVDSLLAIIESADEDTNKVNAIIQLSRQYYRSDNATAIHYGTQARVLAEQIEFRRGLAYAYKSIGLGQYFQGNYLEALLNWQQSYEVFEGLGDRLGMANMLNNLGAVYYNEGANNKAIEYYLESLRVSEELGDSLRIATALVNIGALYYSKQATHRLALKYYSLALPLSEALGDKDAIATSAVNIGQIYLQEDDDETALFYFQKALDAYRQSETGNVPYAMLNIGSVYTFRQDFETAINYQQEAFDLAEKNGAVLEMAQSMLSLGETYSQKGDIEQAIDRYRRASEYASEIGVEYVLKDAYAGLARNYEKKSDFSNAYKYQLLYTNLKDTLYNSEMDKRIEALTLEHDIDQKQGEIVLQDLTIQRQKLVRNATGITGILLLFIALILFNRYRYTRKTKKIIEIEKDRSDRLLLNILPEETAEELKSKGTATPKFYKMASVLFTDFKGFTKIAEKLSPQELIEELNECFLEFDKIIDKHNLEKIKTIGDAYMCAGGIPVANTTNHIDIVKAGLEIKEYMDKIKNEREAKGQDYWELRIGIHTGEVVAGVVGKNKFAYDIWGDAVNTASRMESSGIPGKVNISGLTYELIKDQFECTYRGQIQAKNKGEIDMYIVEKEVS